MRGLVRQAPLVIQVTERFRELIRDGGWAVGDRIPGEHQLAEELGVSRGTVREALRALSITGLLEPRVGDGTYVRATDEITGVLARDDYDAGLTTVLDVRAGLEACAARLAARQPGPFDALDAALAARADAHDRRDRAGYVTADAAFHRGVVVASGNPLLLRLFDAVEGIINQSIEETAVFPEDPGVRDAHAAILQAIRAGDADGAVASSYGLIDGVKEYL